jgi:hypothetical protein
LDVIRKVWATKKRATALYLANQAAKVVPELTPEMRKFLTTYYPHDVVDDMLSMFNVEETLRLINQKKGYSLPSKLQMQSNLQEILPPVVMMLTPETACMASRLEADKALNRDLVGTHSEYQSQCALNQTQNHALAMHTNQGKNLTTDYDYCFSQPTVDLRYRLYRPTEEPITRLSVLVDGRLLGKVQHKKSHNANGLDPHKPCYLRDEAQTQNLNHRNPHSGVTCELPQDDQEYILRVSLPPHDVNVSLVAENQFTTSEPLTTRLRWAGDDHNLYVLAVGLGEYDDKNVVPKNHSKSAVNDAICFAETLKVQEGKPYKKVNIKLLQETKGRYALNGLVGGQRNQAMARKKDVLNGFKWLEQQVQANDVAMLFWSGHGRYGENRQYYLLPRNIDKLNISETGVAYSEIKETLTGLPGKTLFFMDIQDISPDHAKNQDYNNPLVNIINELSRPENGVTVFATNHSVGISKPEKSEQASQNSGNSDFMKALWTGLHDNSNHHRDKTGKEEENGSANSVEKKTDNADQDKNGQITLKELN